MAIITTELSFCYKTDLISSMPMKRLKFNITRLLLIVIVILSGFSISAYCQQPQKKYMRHVERIKPGALPSVPGKMPSANSNRVSTMRGRIVMTYDSTLPDSVKAAIRMAKELWESRLISSQPIYINVQFEPMESDVVMINDVLYMETPSGCPTSLCSQLSGHAYGSVEMPDGFIVLNSRKLWDCNMHLGFAKDNNVTTMVLRGIARTLGFGSSVTQKSETNIDFYFGWPTYFDKLMHNQDGWLHTMKGNSVEMRNFITSGNVVVETPSDTYKVYAPSVYDPDKSLYYLEDKKSIMANVLDGKNIPNEIDDYTVDILNAIGWNIPLNAGNIKCNDISDNNNISAYIPHTFIIDKAEGDVISDYNWSFQLKDESGVYSKISEGSGTGFIIAEISTPEGYYVNKNGEMEGRVECIYTINGKQRRAYSDLLLDLKPVILSIDNLEIHEDKEEEQRTVSFDVNYRGANNIVVGIVDEEYPSSILTTVIREPLTAHVSYKMRTWCYYWIIIEIDNGYGSIEHTIEFAPTTGDDLEKIPATGIDDINHTCNPSSRLMVIKLDGSVLYDGPESNFSKEQLPGGLYIMKTMMPDGTSNVTKVMVQ